MNNQNITSANSITANRITLANKWLFSDTGDTWLRMYNKDGTGYYGGIAANNFYSINEVYGAGFRFHDGTVQTTAAIGGGTSVTVYKCPSGTGGWNPGGAWGSYGCQGQISSIPTCQNIEYSNYQTRNCTLLGEMKVY